MRRERANQPIMPIAIPQTLKNKLLELRSGRDVAAYVPERVDRLLNLEGTEDFFSLNYELTCWQTLYLM